MGRRRPILLSEAELTPLRAHRHLLESRIDYHAICRCGHQRLNHSKRFGCMWWNDSQPDSWCRCDGFMGR
jgi:hypothetical protein